jgi:hypothetical protein
LTKINEYGIIRKCNGTGREFDRFYHNLRGFLLIPSGHGKTIFGVVWN